MKRFWGILLLLTIVCLNSFAQHSIQGKVLDKKSEGAIEMVTIRLLNDKDSSLVKGCMSDLKGEFSLSKIKDGNYILDIRYLGYKRMFRNLTVAGKAVILKNILLTEEDNALKEVEIKGMTAQVAVKGDTIEYNTSAFKTAENAVVEDLLKKLPGVVVDADGKITINGQEIKKVRVDGKKFFDGDMTMATKNIPVDMVDKVQVVDQKSEMAKLTGFEDDNTERIINLTTKANRRKGVFGNVTAGVGADDDNQLRYDGNAFINILNGGAQTALIAGANNTNTQRSGRGRMGMGGGGSGIIATQNLGINNNTELSKTLKVGGDGSYNHSTNTTISESERETYLKESTDLNKSNSKSKRENNQANMRFEMEWNIDTLNTIIVQPQIGYNKGFSESNGENIYYRNNVLTNNTTSNSTGNNDGVNARMNVILNHKSGVKLGRTLTMNVTGSIDNSNNSGFNYSKKVMTDSTSLIDQRSESVSDSYSANARVSYVEPLWNIKNYLELAASFNVNFRSSDRQQFNKDGNGKYTVLDTIFSNSFNNNFFNESVELNFRHQDKNYNYMLGIKAEPSQNYSTTSYKDGFDLTRENKVINYSPTATFRYNFGRKEFARLDYRGRTNQASIDQMQPVRTNSLTNETVGNMSLIPSFNQNLGLMYSSFNEARFSTFNFGINGGFTSDALVSNTITDLTGKRYNQTVNAVNTPYSGGANFMFNTPIIKNRLQFNTRTDARYEKIYGYTGQGQLENIMNEDGIMVLGDLSKTARVSASESLGLTFTTDVIEVGVRGSFSFSDKKNNLNVKNQTTKDYTGSGNINLHLPFKINIANEFNYTTREGYSAFSQDELVWNASIDKSVMKNQGTVSLRFNDILKQKLNIRETINDNYRELVRSNQLTSYFMLSFTCKLAKFGGGVTSDMFRGGGGRENRGGFGGRGGQGGPPPGMDF